ncbi:transmembrane protein, putative (macronuclear) [Tetrahymena thermophila SB210]|uniref:Transmembrane protein, putative n=1 Tax=Tetrahymena thermophila (strain SB210) TaxID=312017 RepID=W7XIG1_TETTS|nr:transmembrane protein, putative [Tetrahymena thermophila SB210]EWS73259.1 transmembrane protein, putative [Tetrahymena thermophila SB210]|eukprot:XP_012654223.1 transmembrane protein, putative [Tetrahymena thermophila SB210]
MLSNFFLKNLALKKIYLFIIREIYICLFVYRVTESIPQNQNSFQIQKIDLEQIQISYFLVQLWLYLKGLQIFIFLLFKIQPQIIIKYIQKIKIYLIMSVTSSLTFMLKISKKPLMYIKILQLK